MVVFASTRTDDLMSMACRLAGFRKHPSGVWCQGQGFPKATNLSKAFDKEAGREREVVGVKPGHEEFVGRKTNGDTIFKDGMAGFDRPWMHDPKKREAYHLQTVPATDEAKQWDGYYYGLQSLKPAIEPWLMFQKPHEGKMTDNVRKWGTGALNIDGCRVPGELPHHNYGRTSGANSFVGASETPFNTPDLGRWPASIILSYPEDTYRLRKEVSIEDLKSLIRWIDENPQ